MLRCSRLLQDDLLKNFAPGLNIAAVKCGSYYAAMQLEPGDRMTGWERAASYPLEVQKKIILTPEGYCLVPIRNEMAERVQPCALYEWNGTDWVEVKE